MEKLPKENESESPTTSPSVYDDVPKPAVVHVEPRIEELVPVSTEYGATVSIGMGYGAYPCKETARFPDH